MLYVEVLCFAVCPLILVCVNWLLGGGEGDIFICVGEEAEGVPTC